MAIYDGFFDAALNEATNEYDRAYDSGDFTGYFEQFIGSGVCVYNDPDSLLVRFRDGSAVVGPGYLFLQGYWLKNDGEYVVSLPGAGVYAIVARLDLGLRTIDVAAQAKAGPEDYPDALVLAYVTVDAAGAGQVEDTRHNTALCGVIDAAGSLSGKVEYAVNYIDTEIDGKLARAEADIAAQAALLDGKIAEVGAQVEKLAPPPIGTVKFSASRDVGAEWLRCDGRFISEAEYPELVAALGKLTPGMEEFKRIDGDTYSGDFSPGVLNDGILWFFSASDKMIVGIDIESNEAIYISVSGADELSPEPSNPVFMSICGGSIFLSQNVRARGFFKLLEGKGFSKGLNSIHFQNLDVSVPIGKIDLTNIGLNVSNGNFLNGPPPGVYFVPEVVYADGAFRLCLGVVNTFLYMSPKNRRYSHVLTLKWSDGGFDTAEVEFTAHRAEEYGDYFNNNIDKFVDAGLRYSRKCLNEMFCLSYLTSGSGSNMNNLSVLLKSYKLGMFSQISSTATSVANATINKYMTDTLTVSPIAEGNTFILRAVMGPDRKVGIRAGQINPVSMFGPTPQVIPINMPHLSSLFPDSLEVVPAQGLWIIFVGTGFLFSKEPLNLSSWGYLDTSQKLGVITQYGAIEFDDERQLLCISGVDTAKKLKAGVLKFPEIYNYANDGAWLPMIASDGVPAYIKAKEPAEGA